MTYCFKNAGYVFNHIAIPETEHPITVTSEHLTSHSVRGFVLNVLAAVELDRELLARTRKIHDISSYRMLAPKFMFGT